MGLGWKPIYDDINLPLGQDWIFERTRASGPFLPETSAEVRWVTGQVWAGTVEGDTISWRVESTQADAIPSNTRFAIWIHYPNGATGTTDDYAWIEGRARRSQHF